ncbi:MAG: DMT family transporter [Gammaproteobacteria bacterium]|nr:DMT family transporter [Gammaproteobacteria bacterium]
MASHGFFIRVAPFLFVLLWSTGFIAAKYSMNNADPFVFLCLRMSLTTLMLIPIIFLVGAKFPVGIWQHRHDMVTGFLLHCCYLGFVFWPIKEGVPSGIVAIIIGLQPLLTMALAALFIGESLSFNKIGGLLLGFVGIAIVIVGKFGIALGLEGGLSGFELSLCIFGLLGMAGGVFYQKKFCEQSQLLTGAIMQYIAAAIATAAFAVLFGETWQIDWTASFVIALSWQVFGLSIGAVVLLMVIIKLGEAGRVSSMFYLVPPLVVIEAHFLFGETLGIISILGMGICVISVYLVNRNPVV